MIDSEMKDKKNCMGCHACFNICPQNCILMNTDNEGFWYPIVDYNKCTSCLLCISVCPTINRVIVHNSPNAYACSNNDEFIRLKSSSGGMFTLIANEIINKGGVVFGAGFDDDFIVIHSWIKKKEELEKFRGSKYVQSKIGTTYTQVRDFLRQGRAVLFTGTPCQIGGLKSFLGESYDKLICLDIICHGVPSPKVFQKYISYQTNIADSRIKGISFRLKNEGWKRYSVSILFNNDTEYRKIYSEDLYMKAFLNDISLRPSCYECAFKTLNRESDITLGDFWGIQNLLPELDDDKGTSLIFVNSYAGAEIFEKIKGNISFKEVNINDAVKYNSAAIKSVESNPNRDKYFSDIDKLPFDKLMKKHFTQKISIIIKMKAKIIMLYIFERIGIIKLFEKIK